MGSERNIRRIITGYGIALIVVSILGCISLSDPGARILSLLALSHSLSNATPTLVYFTPHESQELLLGKTTDIDVRINTRIPINAVGVTIAYPGDALEIVGVSKRDSFLDLWTEDTSIRESAGEIHFSGGTTHASGHIGTATVLTFSVKAKKPGRAELSFKEVEVYPHDGQGKRALSDARPFAYSVVESSAPLQGSSMSASWNPPRPQSPDFNNDGSISIADVSILMVQMFAPYNARYDLDTDGRVSLSDLSVLLAAAR